MNLARLEYFITVAQTGGLRRASEILHVSPPALSKAMKLLEDEMEIKLWVKDGRRILLTDAGKALLKRAPNMIDNLKNLKESLHQKTSAQTTLRIGTFEVFSTYFLNFLDRLQWNDVALELHELLPGEVEKYVASGDLDYGITYLPVPTPDLDFIKVTAIEMGVFTRKGAFKNVAQTDLPFVIPATPFQGVPTKVRGLDGWPEDAYQRKVLHRVTLMESALELCRQGRVAGYFPAFVVNAHNTRVCQDRELERRKSPYGGRVCQADVFLVKRKSCEETHIVRKLAKAIRVVCV
jgi:DNA-binding transcriptional LysR family regulator